MHQETAAYQFERDLRQFVIKEGGVQYRKAVDWFRFDERIYNLLLNSFNKQQTHQAQVTLLSEDEEIALYRQKYYQLLRETVKALELKSFRLQQEIRGLENQIEEVRREEREKARAAEKEFFNQIFNFIAR